MSEPHLARVIPLRELRSASADAQIAAYATKTAGKSVLDRLGRPLRDLRISVTDRCNFRCSYCMPKEVFGRDYRYLPHDSLLNFDEITRLSRQFVELGVRKLRLTGGEPLLRKNVEQLVRQLSELRTPEGEEIDLTMTTNGALLASKARALKEAGLNRVTVSLDGLNDEVFKRMNDVDFPVGKVLKGIEAAQAAGISNIKVNMVVKRGTNEHEVLPMAKFFRGTGVTLRFIEFMDVGATNGWRMADVVPSEDIVRLISSELPLVPLAASSAGETAQRYGYAGQNGQPDKLLGEVGVISSVTKAFCSDCNRARLSTEGRLFLCLFGSQGVDLRQFLRGENPMSDVELINVIAGIWQSRADRYSELREKVLVMPSLQRSARPEMSYIGG
ncbi:GTP 3',8-cyclase [Comamonadaceae bacterium OS-4]|nr:GTP 3',8-cyclase [Comamonadaceae bacterium OS-4]